MDEALVGRLVLPPRAEVFPFGLLFELFQMGDVGLRVAAIGERRLRSVDSGEPVFDQELVEVLFAVDENDAVHSPEAEADLSLLQIDGLSSEYIVEEARDVTVCWPSMNVGERRQIVESLVKKITIGKEEIDITLC